MIKILHTSDLHIGKRLYQEELAGEQGLFFQWLTGYIREQGVDALLVAGDVFDVANPSSEARRIYYSLLHDLARLGCKVIITGGNHDSPAMLEAPAGLLKNLDIHIAGTWEESPEKMLIPLGNKAGQPEAVVACIPFLRDADLRHYTADESYEERTEAVREGIARVYQKAASWCRELYPDAIALAMGHLFVQGASVSDSERDIQIGNLAGLDMTRLPGHFAYYALGHLHKPQQPGGGKLFYSGSPVKLSFSERSYTNRVMLISLDKGQLSAESIALPACRRLLRYSGSVAELTAKLADYRPAGNGNVLPDFIELEAIEPHHDPACIQALEKLIGDFKTPAASILNYRIRFENQPRGAASLFGEAESLTELRPADVFDKKMESDQLDESMRGVLREAFLELLQETEQENREDAL